MTTSYKKAAHYGPGGRNCNCCGPAPRHRRRFDRMVKRRVKQEVEKEVKEELSRLRITKVRSR